jgi:ABC-type nitrate/sulfonate/bicarbonate transport system substrate-binding protein
MTLRLFLFGNDKTPKEGVHMLSSKTLKITIMALVFTSIVPILAACGSGDKDSADAGKAAPQEEVSIQFGWVHSPEYAGLYVAQEDGLYAEENLKVDFHIGGFDADDNFIFPIDSVTSGEADFGIVSGDQLLQARATGAPVVAIAAIYQRSPVVLMSLTERSILRPQDLIGKTLASDLQTATGLSILAMLNSQGIEPNDVNIIRRTDFSNTPLTNGDVDVLDGFITNQPILLKQDGYDLNLMLVSDYGIDFYTNVIFTTEQMIAERPDVVEGFLKATLKGYTNAINDPQHGAEVSHIYDNETSSETLLETDTAIMLTSVPLINPTGSKPGLMNPATWDQIYETLLEQNILTQPLEVSAAYTTAFLDAIYADQ